MKNVPLETGHNLRQQATVNVQRHKTTIPQQSSPDDAQKLLHELQVHQIELTMQNDELQRKQIELESALALYHLAPISYLILNDKGAILEANRAATTMLGRSRDVLLKGLISQLIFAEDLEVYLQYSKRRIDGENLPGCEVRLESSDGSLHWVLLQATSAHNAQHWITLSDISQRKLAEKLLQDSERFTIDVMDSLTSNIAVLDSNGTIIVVNEPWQHFAHENRCFGTFTSDVGINYLEVCKAGSISRDDEGARSAFIGISKVLQGDIDTFSLEYPCHSPDKQQWFILHVSRLSGSRHGAVVTHIDITKQKQLEDILKNNNSNLEKLIAKRTFQLTEAQRIAHIGSWELDLLKSKWTWSDEVFRIYGLQMDELPSSFEVFLNNVHPDDRTQVNSSYTHAVAEGLPYNVIHRIIRNDDLKIRYVSVQCIHTFNTDGHVIKSLGTVQDVTDLVAKENDLKEYAHHIVKMIENERIRIARELHDDLGQALTVLSFAIKQLKHDHLSRKKVLQSLPDMQSGVDHMMESIRRICTALRPALLDELGLQAAIKWLCKDFSRRTGLPCSTSVTDNCCPINNMECCMTIFRIVQESLNNTMKHAGASRADISLSRNDDGSIYVEISDDGCGMAPQKHSGSNRSFGIIGMRERAHALGAHFEIISKKGKGTTVTLIIPCGNLGEDK